MAKNPDKKVDLKKEKKPTVAKPSKTSKVSKVSETPKDDKSSVKAASVKRDSSKKAPLQRNSSSKGIKKINSKKSEKEDVKNVTEKPGSEKESSVPTKK